MSNFDINSAAFNPELRMLETTDPAHADTFNALFGQLIRNDVAVMRAAGQFAGSKNAQAEFLLNMRKDGLKYGVHWDPFSATPSPVGTRILDNVGKVCEVSTNETRGRNDLENTSVFYHLEVNGSVDANGDFQVEAIKGIDDTFDRFTKDVWCLFLPQWTKIEINALGEDVILSDTKFDGSFPEGGAIRPDGSIRPFVAIAKYQDSSEGSGTPNSVSGHAPSWSNSHNSLITKMHRKGNQYCSTTLQDWTRMTNLFMVAFATRNIQSIMYGAYSYYVHYPCTVQETDAERIIISKNNAKNLVVGSCVSIGHAKSDDRNAAKSYELANRVKIVSIEDYVDGVNAVVTVDNKGVKFSTAPDEDGNAATIMTYPWWTGACDDVLGSCGAPALPTSGKTPYLLFGVEYALGQYEVVGNAFLSIEDAKLVPYICYDATKLATSITSDYVKTAIRIPDNQGSWKYISVLGFDANNPMVRFGEECNASSSTGYCDAQYTEMLDAASGLREILLGGALYGGTNAGRRYAFLYYGLTGAYWGFAARLSASGRCSQRAS